ncbi:MULTISPECIES: hypothetical protein [unclassified Streptomyces]|uniref:hypothetical protein n=1 Tax=unclassified Streptomyces TaxID=2593676 RepID=UPI000939C0DD|nr:hypothetical protein [Streptomyces sp. CB02400]OKK12550.1 hypothetical protein AMK33_06625 [Streptomyces sp. CB02400]
MKSLKAAAVLAGTLIAAGAAAPAYAVSLDLAQTGVDTGLHTAVPFELMPAHESEALVDTDDESLLGTTKEAAATVNEAKPVHGDLGLHA